MGVSSRRKAARSNRLSRTLSRTLVNNSLRLGWAVCLVWGELGVYYWSLSSCKWPERAEWRRGKPTHVLLISDPQVRHPSGRGSGWNLRQFLHELQYELNLKRSWHATRRLNPHEVFFLGDQLSSGKFVRSEAEYAFYWRKFQEIFRPLASAPHYYIPGNNDVGMGLSHSNVRLYYSTSVGPFNREIVICDHVFVALDAPGLVDDDYQRSGTPYDVWTPARGGTVEFVTSVAPRGLPTILLSHIPMARPDSASCGPLREKGAIRRGVGHGYQTMLGKHTTAFLLKTLRPSAIFSGDNRDYCEYNHPADGEEGSAIREISIKSFSQSVHIRRPGFQLLSLVDPIASGKSIADAPCLLPDIGHIHTTLYAPLAFLTLIVLFAFNAYRSRRLRNMPLPQISLSPMDLTPGQLSPRGVGSNAVWSPYTPPISPSPRHGLPPTIRTPNALAGPTMRASRPATPTLGSRSSSPMLAPSIVFHPEPELEDEEDPLFPAQYAVQRNGHVPDDDEWPAPRDDPAPEFFLPAPGNPKLSLAANNTNSKWSWTFVFRGRRRRLTLRAPSWAAVRELVGLLTPGGDSDIVLRRRGVVWATILDAFSVLWPTVVLWVVFAWWMI